MRDLPIELFGSPLLRARANAVTRFDPPLRDLVAAMFRTMYRAGGQGLAAPQVGVCQRIVVIDMPEEDSPALTLINPRLEPAGPERRKFEEGCLSMPGVKARVERHTRVVVHALDADGREFRVDAQGELAVCLQHELDHLDGILYIDHLSPLERQLVLKRYGKLAERRQA